MKNPNNLGIPLNFDKDIPYFFEKQFLLKFFV